MIASGSYAPVAMVAMVAIEADNIEKNAKRILIEET